LVGSKEKKWIRGHRALEIFREAKGEKRNEGVL